MRESRKNGEKLFLLKVCLPLVYEGIGEEGVEAVEKGWAKEQDYSFINALVHKYIATAREEVLSYDGSMQEKTGLIRTFNFFLYAYIERKNPSTIEEVDDAIKQYYENLEESVKLGG